MDIGKEVLEFLLKSNGVSSISYLGTLVRDVPDALHAVQDLERSGQVEISGDRDALGRLTEALDLVRDQPGISPDALRQRFWEGLNEIPGAEDVVVKLS